jgi:hypothetical protein
VRDGIIVTVGGAVPAGVESIPGDGKTLLPGLIDAHTHAYGDALERALVFGVTTELDMFTDYRFAAAMRKEQQNAATPNKEQQNAASLNKEPQSADGALRRADLFSAGTLITAPKGHGTEYNLQIPTLESAADAPRFVDARLAEGSDYIKIVYDDNRTFGRKTSAFNVRTLD